MPPCFGRVDKQRGPYNSAAHESFRAVARSITVHQGHDTAQMIGQRLLRTAGCEKAYGSYATPEVIYHVRKLMEEHLPDDL